MELQTIKFHVKDGIATISLNRPEVLNAINQQLASDFVQALEACKGDEVRVVIVKGEGRAFCSGDDLKGGGGGPEETAVAEPQLGIRKAPYYSIIRALRKLRKPVLCQVHGYAVGAGLDVMLGCDIIIAAENARLGLPNTLRGLTGPTYMLSHAVGYHKACELSLTGELVDGKEAHRIGLVNRVVPPEHLEEAVTELAGKLAKGATKAKGAAKLAINGGLQADFERGSDLHALALALIRNTEDIQEGRQAFLEKREPQFKGR